MAYVFFLIVNKPQESVLFSSNRGPMANLESHISGLAHHCRICGKKYSKRDERIDKLSDKELIKLTYNIDLDKDEEHIHPQ